MKKYLNFIVTLTGLVVHPEHPHLGVSPDGVVLGLSNNNDL